MDTKKFIGSTFLGKYKIIKLLDRGGMDSEIYLAENLESTSLDYFSSKYRYAAIKIIRKTNETTSDHWNRILDEGVTNARLNDCENVVKLVDWIVPDNNTIVLILEYLDGQSLKMLIRNKGCLPIDEALWIFENILQGIIYMQNQTGVIIHRDLKPENILLSKDCLKVKISDFGISSVVMEKTNNKEILTNEETFFGTIPYLTPDVTKKETIDGKKVPSISKQYDFHSLGIILYEMLIGDKPFEILDENDPKVILYFKKFDFTPISKINPKISIELENIILKLTASKDNDIKLRYSSANEILDDIKKIRSKYWNSFDPLKSVKPFEKRIYQKIDLFSINLKKDFINSIFKLNRYSAFFCFSILLVLCFFVTLILVLVL